ncbi:MAG: hypothetical protein IT334_12230, partial [Thermomicrobiales bacterium]|nr:hypothetical protein [Thermomicrobiales bacterium]
MTETPIDSAKPPRSQRTHLVTALMAIGLFVLLLVPRLADLDALITPDEPLWVQRSAAFYGSLADGSFDHPDRAVHPGVMVMWSSVPVYGLVWNEAAGYLDFELEGVRALDETQLKLAEHGELLIDLLVDLRRSLTVFSALVMIALFFCLIPLIGRWQAAVAVAFVGFDPLHIGFTRLLHLDGVSANLRLVVIVAWCACVMRGDRRWLILSGIATGMAIITRSVNFASPGIIGLFILIEWLQVWRKGGDLRHEFV